MKVTIVIPTYNERENISKLIPSLFGQFEKSAIDGNVIVVDDNSPDGTAAAVRNLAGKYDIKLIDRPTKMGLGSAYITGFKEAILDGANVIFEMDADMSHDPEKLPEFMKKLDDGYDVVVGSRLMEGGGVVGWGPARKIISFCGNMIGKHITGINVSDMTSGYRAYRRKVLESIELGEIRSTSYDFQLEILYRAIEKGFKVSSIPIVFHDRRMGKSKLSKNDLLKFFLTALKLRFDRI